MAFSHQLQNGITAILKAVKEKKKGGAIYLEPHGKAIQKESLNYIFNMNTNKSKIPSIANEIRQADTAVREWQSKKEPLSATMVMQYELLKKDLLKDLLVELIQSNISFKSAGNFIQRLTLYLQKSEQEETISEAIKKELKSVEKILA